MSSPCPAMLRVILGEHDIRKLLLPSGIPNTVDDLLSVIKQSFQLDGHLRLLYMDTDFGQFFTLTSAEDLKDKDSIKVVQVEEPSVILTLTPASRDFEQCSTDTQTSDSSRDTMMLPPREGRFEKWPDKFEVPQFTFDVERILQVGNQAFFEDGTLLQNQGVKSDIMQKLAESIFKYTAYPTNLQILSVVEALIEKFPCLKEPGSFSGMYGWQQSLKYKMGNYRSKLRNQKLDLPELEVNSLKRKQPNDRVPSKNVKKPKKAELNYLPPHPHGESLESLENEQKALLDEIKKKDNQRVIAVKMSKTFSYRRHEVVNLAPPIKDFQQRWPALFTEAQAS
uniref:PB1 domain-containing protein n=1 Tax=Paramormyrops kingsleyae TaxID=1676925 RepID=A0A3B3RUC4_9TELE